MLEYGSKSIDLSEFFVAVGIDFCELGYTHLHLDEGRSTPAMRVRNSDCRSVREFW